MRKVIGKILNKANIEYFQFVANEYFDSKFIEVEANHISNGAKIIGEVVEKEAVNPYFERPSDIRFVREDDETFAKRSLFVAKVKYLATVQDGKQKLELFPPTPGSNVYSAQESDIKVALNLEDEGIELGRLKGYNLPFKILPNKDKLFKTHISIVGQTGSGKSYLAAKLATELLKLRRSADVPSTIPTPIIFDSSGEYSNASDFGGQKILASIMKIQSIKEHSFPLLNNRYLSLLYDIFEINEKQESELRVWLSHEKDSTQPEVTGSQQELLKQEDSRKLVNDFGQIRFTSTSQLAEKLEDYIKRFNKVSTEKIAIPYNVMSKMNRFNLNIKKTDDLDIVGQLFGGLIIDLSELDGYDKRQIYMLLYLRQIYEAAKSKKIGSNVVLFIDEAHNYVPSVYKSYCKNEILRLAREGRKYGIILCLISQRPRWVDPTALSQCGNIFIFRIQNSDDKKYIFDSASLPDSVKDMDIAKLKTGEMIVAGDIVGQPLDCLISPIDSEFISSMAKSKAKEHIKAIRGAENG